jgi:hypothetical protein
MAMRLGPVTLLLAALCASCGGSRKLPPPASPEGYQALTVHDVMAVAPRDANIEVVGALGALASHERCDGLLTFTLSDPAQAVALPPTASPAAAAAITNILVTIGANLSGIVVTLPRTRYAEVRDLKPADIVRVRGYVSDYEAQGCNLYTERSNRFIWVDSIERVSPAPH